MSDIREAYSGLHLTCCEACVFRSGEHTCGDALYGTVHTLSGRTRCATRAEYEQAMAGEDVVAGVVYDGR